MFFCEEMLQFVGKQTVIKILQRDQERRARTTRYHPQNFYHLYSYTLVLHLLISVT